MKAILTAAAFALAATSVAALNIFPVPPVLTFPEATADISSQDAPLLLPLLPAGQ